MPYAEPRTWLPGDLLDQDDLNEQVRDNLAWLYDNLPTRASLWHADSIITNGNALAHVVAGGQPFNLYSYQDPAADGDSFTQSVVLGAGTYTMTCLGYRLTSAGRLDWTLDGTSIATGQDWYNGSNLANQTQVVLNIVVGATAGGRHVLQATVNGHHASSSGYVIQLTQIWFKTAADT